MSEPTKPKSKVKPPQTVKDTSFVHSFLDDLKLKPIPFRIYLHLRRRADNMTGKANPGMRSIAKVCCIDKTSVKPAISELVARGMLWIEKGRRSSNVYLLTNPSEWVENPDSLDKAALSEKSLVTACNLDPVTVREITTQGNPSGNPLKEIQSGDSFDSMNADRNIEEEIFEAYPNRKTDSRATLKAIRSSLQTGAEEPDKAEPFALLAIVKQFAKRMHGHEKYVPVAGKWFTEERWKLSPEAWGGKPISSCGIGLDPNRQIPYNATKGNKRVTGRELGKKFGVG